MCQKATRIPNDLFIFDSLDASRLDFMQSLSKKEKKNPKKA